MKSWQGASTAVVSHMSVVPIASLPQFSHRVAPHLTRAGSPLVGRGASFKHGQA